MQFLQPNVDGRALLEKMLWEGNFPINLAQASLDVVGHGEPLGAHKVKKNLHRHVDVRG
jgi:hypothetical protein